MSARYSIIAASIVLAFSVSVEAAPAASLKEAAARAIAANPEVEARWHAFKASRAERDVARGGFMPRVDLSASVGAESRTRPDTDDNDFTRRGASLSVSQMLYDGFETRSEVERLGYVSLARYYELLDSAENAALESARAYLDVLRFRELVRLAKENYLQHRQVFEQIQERTTAGVGRRVDLEQASGRLALAESNLLTEASNLHDVSARYQRVVGEVPPDNLPVTEVPTSGLPPSVAAALNAAYQGNPALAASQENVRAAQAEARGKESGMRPRLDLRARQDVGYDNDGIDGRHGDRVVELVLNYNLFRGGSDRARVRQFAEQLNLAQDLRDKSCRDLRQTLSIAYNDVARLTEQLRYLDQHQLSIEKAREAYRKQFDIGQRTLLDLLDTENEYFQARRAYASATSDLAIAKARTLASIGQLMKTLGLVRADLPTPQELGQDRESIDVSSACPAEAPVQQSFDKQALFAAAPRPVASVVPASVAEPVPVATPEVALSQRSREWAAAWSERQVSAYLAFYSSAFKPANGLSRADWEAARRRLVGKAEPISVSIEEFRTDLMGADRALTEFRQRYASGSYSDVVTKRLEWQREGGVWKIVSETVR